MGPFEAHDQPSYVVAEQGAIIIDGPAGVAVTMTADAAEETARRLLAAAAEARRQEPHQPAHRPLA